MFLIALRTMLHQKGRLFAGIGGVTFSIILMVALTGIYNGSIERDARFLSTAPADIFIMRKGVTNIYRGVQRVALSDLAAIAQESGVEKLLPVNLTVPSIVEGLDTYNLFV